MAAKKTTTETPKTHTLTEKHIPTLRDLATDIFNIRRTLEDLKGENDISTIMFQVGAMYNVAEAAETAIDDFLSQFDEEECDECGNDW